jgi:hypothetical protein
VTTEPPSCGRVGALRRRLRAHPYAVDVLIAAGALGVILLAGATEPHGPHGGPRFGDRPPSLPTVLLALLVCGSLVLRRRAPLHVLCVTTLFSVVQLAVEPHTDPGPDRRAPLVLTAVAMAFGAGPWYAQENLGVLAWTLTSAM